MGELLFFVAIVVVVWIFASRVKYKPQSAGTRRSAPAQRKSKRVKALSDVFRSETLDLGQEWRFEAASDKQLRYLTELAEDEDLSIPRSLTKGQASDAIGVFHEADEEEIAQLKFLKVPSPGRLNQTEARVKLYELLSDPANLEQWQNRPASSEQKDQIRFLGGKVPKGLSHPDAQEVVKKLVNSNEALSDRWDDLRMAYDDTVDPDSRDLYDIKKFSWKQFCDVVEQMESAGKELSEITSDEEKIYEALLQKNPALEK